MRLTNDIEYFEFETPLYVRSMAPGTQWWAHEQGDKMQWMLDCPGLGHGDPRLNMVTLELVISAKYPQLSGRYYHIPELDSPLFYSQRAAAKWAMEFEYSVEEDTLETDAA
jgi:hypothetical protein